MTYTYATTGTCSKKITFDLENGVVSHVQFAGGCPGNTQGVARLLGGMTVDKIEELLKGIKCGARPTSCPDQLAIAVREAASQQ